MSKTKDIVVKILIDSFPMFRPSKTPVLLYDEFLKLRSNIAIVILCYIIRIFTSTDFAIDETMEISFKDLRTELFEKYITNKNLKNAIEKLEGLSLTNDKMLRVFVKITCLNQHILVCSIKMRLYVI